jgi:hypothetical protein
LNFKDAFQMVMEIHEECGDKNLWGNMRDQLRNDSERFKNFGEWESRLNSRTDISDDDRWDIECMLGSVAVLFALMGKV